MCNREYEKERDRVTNEERDRVTNEERDREAPLLIELHWLPVAARIKFKSLMLAYSAYWFCSHLPKCSCKGKCYTQDAALV